MINEVEEVKASSSIKLLHTWTKHNFNNLFLTRDRIKFTKEKNNYFYVLQIDQEKAFDKIDRNFLFKTMQKLGVSPLYIKFIKMLYTNNTSTIINSGFLSSPISLETDKQRSHRQLIKTSYIKRITHE